MLSGRLIAWSQTYLSQYLVKTFTKLRDYKKCRVVCDISPDCSYIKMPFSIQCVVRPKPEAALRTPQEALVCKHLNQHYIEE